MKRTLLFAALLALGPLAHAGEVGNYPDASNPLSGTERLLADQSDITVNITPVQLAAFIFPGGTLSPSQFPALLGDCTNTAGTLTLTCLKTNGVVFAASATTDTTVATNITSGTLPAARLPNPGASSLGGVQSIAVVAHNFLTGISTLGVPTQAQPACSDLSNAAASCSTDATNAANIGTGTLPAARLPNPSASSLGGVQSIVVQSHLFLTGISTSGVPSASQPSVADLSTGTTGSGNIVLATNGVLVTPNLGTPSALNLANATNLQSAALPGTIAANTTGNALTATALASVPAQCGASQFATGITANGTANCGTPAGAGTVTSVSVVTANGLSGTVANATSTPAITLVPTWTGIGYSNGSTIAAAIASNFPTLNQSTSGNAATATALASLPSQCSGGQFATGVAASGNANCGTPAGASGANPSATLGLSAINGSATTYMRSDAAPALSQSITPTWTGIHTFTNSDVRLLGSSTGYTTFTSANAGASNFTLTIPANSGTIAEANLAQSWSQAQTFINSGIVLTGSSTGATTIASANAGASNFTVTLPASSGTVLITGTTITVAQGGTGATTLTGVIKGNGTSPLSAAASTDVISLWTGSCSSSNFLRGDGACATPSGAGTVTTTGSPANGNLAQFSGASSITNGNLSGDATTSNTLAVTVTKTNGVAFGTFATQNYATPPAIGGVTPAAGTFTNVAVTGTAVPNVGINQCVSGFLCLYSNSGTVNYVVDSSNSLMPTASVGSTGATGNFIGLPAVSGVPTGVPANPGAYASPICVIDSTDMRLYCYASSAWSNLADSQTNANATTLSVSGTATPSGKYGINQCISNGATCLYANGAVQFEVDKNGNTILTSGSVATNATNGFAYFNSTAGVPTGTPATLTGGGYANPPTLIDTTHGRLYEYSGGWVNVADSPTSTTGTGATVLANSPTLVTPTLGVATATSLNGNTFTAGTYTLTGSAGKTLTFTNTLTLAGTDSTTFTFPGTSGTVDVLNNAQTFTAVKTFTNSDLCLLGSSTGCTTFTSANASATNYTLTFPAVNATLATANIQQNVQSGSTYPVAASDANGEVYNTDTSPVTWTIPANASVPYVIGTCIMFTNSPTGGTITLAITSDTLYFYGDTGSRSIAAFGSAVACKKTATIWYINGFRISDLIAPMTPVWLDDGAGSIHSFGDAANDAMFDVRNAA